MQTKERPGPFSKLESSSLLVSLNCYHPAKTGNNFFIEGTNFSWSKLSKMGI
jgi:hypothetical protein